MIKTEDLMQLYLCTVGPMSSTELRRHIRPVKSISQYRYSLMSWPHLEPINFTNAFNHGLLSIWCETSLTLCTPLHDYVGLYTDLGAL